MQSLLGAYTRASDQAAPEIQPLSQRFTNGRLCAHWNLAACVPGK